MRVTASRCPGTERLPVATKPAGGAALAVGNCIATVAKIPVPNPSSAASASLRFTSVSYALKVYSASDGGGNSMRSQTSHTLSLTNLRLALPAPRSPAQSDEQTHADLLVVEHGYDAVVGVQINPRVQVHLGLLQRSIG